MRRKAPRGRTAGSGGGGRKPPKARRVRHQRRHAETERPAGSEGGATRARRAEAVTNTPANLGAEIANVAVVNAIVGNSATLDATACDQFGPEIQEQFGVPVDSPELFQLVTVQRSGWREAQRFQGWHRIAAEYSELLERHRGQEHKLLTRLRYAPSHPRLGLDALIHRREADCEELISSLGRLATDPNPPEQQKRRPGPIVDAALNQTASAVADWTQQHGQDGQRDWTATAKILRCYGWDMSELGVSPEQQGARLEDRVRKARQKGKIGRHTRG